MTQITLIEIEVHSDTKTPEEGIEAAKEVIRHRIRECGVEYLIDKCMKFKPKGSYVSAVEIPGTEANKLYREFREK